MSVFQWNLKSTRAAMALAEGETQEAVAADIGVSARTLRRWLAVAEFSQEVDRLSLMLGIASRAERLRIAKRIVRDKLAADPQLRTEKDLLDWLKFAQSETDGIKLGLTETLIETLAPLAGGGSDGPSESKG